MREIVVSRSCWSTSGQKMLKSTWLESGIEFSRVAMMFGERCPPALPAKLQESSDSDGARRPHGESLCYAPTIRELPRTFEHADRGGHLVRGKVLDQFVGMLFVCCHDRAILHRDGSLRIL